MKNELGSVNTTECGKVIEKIGLERGQIHRDYIAHCLRWSFVKKVAKRGMMILDVGCGRGMLEKMLYSSKLKPKLYYALDIRRSAIEEVMNFKTNFPKIGQLVDIRIGEIGGCEGDYEEAFDLAVCFEVIEHFGSKYLDHVLSEIKRVLKPGGLFLLSTPNYDGVHKAKHHVHEYFLDELGEYIARYFSVKRRHGTFASQKDLEPNLSNVDLIVYEKLKEWFDVDVLATIFASMYPLQSRNVLWVCEKVN